MVVAPAPDMAISGCGKSLQMRSGQQEDRFIPARQSDESINLPQNELTAPDSPMRVMST